MENLKMSIVIVLLLNVYFPLIASNTSSPPFEENLILTTSQYDEAVNQDPCPVWSSYCKGTKFFSDGSVYSGYFRFGEPHGFGTFDWKNGNKYSGFFVNGVRNGLGKFTYANGNMFEGEFKNGVIQGVGTFIWTDGQEYVGSFEQGKIHGEGKMYFINGESYSGMWSEGYPSGQGVYLHLDGSKFIGNNREGQRHGEGVIALESGDTLRAHWSNDKIEGQSIFSFDNGDQLINEWEDGKVFLQNSLYLTSEGQEIQGSLGEIEEDLLLQDRKKLLEFQENLSLGLFSFAVEFKTSGQYQEAMSYLSLAQHYTPYNSKYLQKIVFQLKDIEEKKEANAWARLNE